MEFKPFDKIIFRQLNKSYSNVWQCGFYSHNDNGIDVLASNQYLRKEIFEILPFKGNEHLVGTSNNPNDLLVKLGDLCVFTHDFSNFKTECVISIIKSFDQFTFGAALYHWRYCIPYENYNPNLSIQELEKLAFKIEDGIVKRYSD